MKYCRIHKGYKCFPDADLKNIVGIVFDSVRISDNENIIFNGERVFEMFHDQDCCEGVWIEDIEGELSYLENTPILEASVEQNFENPLQENEESFTWTFYKFRTIKGYVTIRWYGSSNGYYSEVVDFIEHKCVKD